MSKPKLFRLATVDNALFLHLNGQLRYLSAEFDVTGVATDLGLLDELAAREGIKVINLPMRREIKMSADLKSLWKLYTLFRREKPYIVHANSPKASLLGMIAAMAARVPHRIYTVTGLRFETAHGPLLFILKMMERITCLCATKVIPESEGVKNTLLREHITFKPMQKIHNGNICGVDLEHFSRTDDILQKATKIKRKENDFTFIFIGRIVRDKGVNELVEAFDRLNNEYNNTRLILLGIFEDKLDPVSPQTKLIIEQNANISNEGYQHDIRPYLAASDILVLPSYREGFPNVILQAGAMGLPCIVTDINGSNEAISNGVNGIIIPKMDSNALYNAMKQTLLDKDKTNAMADCSRELVASRYRREDIWQATLEMYRAL